jgi:prephenate dehydratase
METTTMTTAQTQPRANGTPALTMTAAFEGIEGAYSHVVLEGYAAKRDVTFVPLGCESFRAVAHAVLSGRADVGLLPIDNAIAGTIREGYDILAEYAAARAPAGRPARRNG